MNAQYGVSRWPNVQEVNEKMDRLVNSPPVSYTHLDVYKRQAICRCVI